MSPLAHSKISWLSPTLWSVALLTTTSTVGIGQEGATLRRMPALGIAWQESDPGVVVLHSLHPEGVAAKAGFLKGDTLVSVNGQPVRSGDRLVAVLKDVAVGEKVVIQTRRGGEVAALTFIMPAPPVNMFGASFQAGLGGRAEVADVTPETPAERAGLRIGDLVRSMAGRRHETLPEMIDFMKKLSPQSVEPIEVTVDRSGASKPVQLVIEREPQVVVPPRDLTNVPARELKAANTRTAVLGVAVREVGGRVVITKVFEREPAALAGLAPGDVLLSVANQPVNSYRALVAEISRFKPQTDVALEVVRGDKAAVITVRVSTTNSETEDVVLDQPAVSPEPISSGNELRDLKARVEALELIVDQLRRQLRAP